ncbi:MAG: hypothetical protein CMK89_09335 [Pseudomonadales bacterium]|jgi:Flp pilus assembly pilin Flp|nr:hypothetical protein [Pseudomonadales bacterium]
MSNKRITGQGMSEYLVIVGLLAVAGIAAMGLMGGSVRQTLAAFASEFSGNDPSANRDAARDNALNSGRTAVAGLDNYEDNNDQLGATTGVTVANP